MSSDLWAAFTSTSEDPTSNPWAQNADKETNNTVSSPFGGQTGESLDLRSLGQSLNDPWTPQAGASPQSFATWPANGISGADAEAEATTHCDGDEEFGDFAESEPHAASKPNRLAGHPAATNESTALQDRPSSNRTSQSSQPFDPFANLDELSNDSASMRKAASLVEVTNPAQSRKPSLALVEELVPYTEEEWGGFSPEPIGVPVVKHQRTHDEAPTFVEASASSQHSISRRSSSEASSKSQIQPRIRETRSAKLAPTNVPPPSRLINLITSLVQRLPDQVERVLKGRDVSKHSDTALKNAMQGCMASLRVAARVIAGRKLRWKRDQHLAQNMSIGPAGRAGGMKLAGIDKSEAQRESREAAEFVRIWKQRLGAIRSALATVNSSLPGNSLALPSISEVMAIRTLKPGEGATTSSRCCFLCGLKREERIDKVDHEVWDSFEEFWIENWGHSECKDFWEGHERYLLGLK